MIRTRSLSPRDRRALRVALLCCSIALLWMALRPSEGLLAEARREAEVQRRAWQAEFALISREPNAGRSDDLLREAVAGFDPLASASELAARVELLAASAPVHLVKLDPQVAITEADTATVVVELEGRGDYESILYLVAAIEQGSPFLDIEKLKISARSHAGDREQLDVVARLVGFFVLEGH
jgi:hypothetical protein